MANKEPISAADIRRLAAKLSEFAQQYEDQAARVEKVPGKRIEFALGTLEDAVLKRVRSNINSLTSRINDALEYKKQIKKRDDAEKSRQKSD